MAENSSDHPGHWRQSVEAAIRELAAHMDAGLATVIYPHPVDEFALGRLPGAMSAMRRSLPPFAMLKPRSRKRHPIENGRWPWG
jgi:hypothetical protein